MTPIGQIAKSVSVPRTGLFATLRGLLHVNGTGAPKTSQGTGLSRVGLLAVLVMGLLAFTAAPALAAAPETPETGKANAATITATTVTLEGGVLNPHAALGELAEYEYRFRASPTECEGEGSTAGMAAGDEAEVVSGGSGEFAAECDVHVLSVRA